MKLRTLINSALTSTGYCIIPTTNGRVYQNDGLITEHNHDFVLDPQFRAAYDRGVEAARKDYRIEWRVHMALWAAVNGSKLEGDFVECGVNWGFISSAIMQYLDWDHLHKTFYLLDTFNGVDEELIDDATTTAVDAEMSRKYLSRGKYNSNVENAIRNFSEWKHVTIIRGSVPSTLDQVAANRVAYLHLDMNCVSPEVAALEFFWPKLSPGAIVLLDDYGFGGHEAQKAAMDACAAQFGVTVASLPTGQGLILKPAV